MRVISYAAAIVASVGIASSWPWPPSLGDLTGVHRLEQLFERRQDSNDNSGTSAALQHTTQTEWEWHPSSHLASSFTPITTGTPTSATGKPSNSTITSIPNTAPAGGANFLQPNTQFAGSQYYYVGTTVTWIWNYTSLLSTPAHIDIVATVSSTAGIIPPSPYTLATNMTFKPTATFTWDLGAYASETALAIGLYKLQIFDADNPAGVSAFPSPGKLAPQAAFTFGVYTPAPYAVLGGIQCATCNAAGGKMERLAFGTLALSVAITLGTMAWFTGIHGIW